MKLTPLRGHSAMVTCAAGARDDPHVVATGSEDASVRLWDIRSCKSFRRLSISSGDGVASVAETSTVQKWTVAAGRRALNFDLRGTDRVIVNEYTVLVEAGDDIGDVDVYHCPEEKAENEIEKEFPNLGIDYVASVDDEGRVRSSMGNHAPANIIAHPSSLGCGVRFVTNDMVVSGGFDNTLVFSSLSENKTIARLPVASLQNFNPPHVHAIDVRDGVVAAAIGDGSVIVVEPLKHRKADGSINWHKVLNNQGRLIDVHSSPIACIKFSSTGSIISGGLDKIMSTLQILPGNRLKLIAKAPVPCKPNAIYPVKQAPGSVVICDTENEAKLGMLHA